MKSHPKALPAKKQREEVLLVFQENVSKSSGKEIYLPQSQSNNTLFARQAYMCIFGACMLGACMLVFMCLIPVARFFASLG